MSSISKLVSTALGIFESLELIAVAHVPTRATTVRSNITRFKIWAGSTGAHRPYGHRSLEYRLSGASMIRAHVVNLLDDLCQHLQEAEIALRRDDQDPEENTLAQQDGGLLDDYFADDEPDMDDFQQVLLQVNNDVNCLMRLAVTIRNPAPHEQFKLRMPALVCSLDKNHTQHALHKFPRLELQPELAERLGKALTYRRLFLRYRQEHHERLNEGIDVEREGEEQDENGESRGGVTTEASWLPKDNGEEDEPRPRVWRDDISEQTGTSYTPSCIDDSELRVPHIPPEYSEGPFLCPYCFLPILIENRYQWKQHVFADLRPYNCLEPGCAYAETGFARRKDWFTHIVREHWRTWPCPLGCAERLATFSLLSDHMRQKHGTATALPEVDFDDKDDTMQTNGNCPLCWEHEIVSARQYQSHVGQHLEQLALFALPGAEEAEEQIEEENNGVSESESHETEDEYQPTDEYEREQEIPPNGSPKSNATGEAKNMLDGQQDIDSSEHFSNSGRLQVPQETNDGFTSTFAQYLVSPSIDEYNRTLPEDDLLLSATHNKEEFGNEEIELFEAAKARLAEETAKKDGEELFKKIEETRADGAEEAKKAADEDEDPIKFKDALGRQFNFPWKLCSTWNSMEDLIQQAFAHVEIYGPHVREGHYDLIGPDGDIILPVVWEKTVQPGRQINMRMWPMDKHPLQASHMRLSDSTGEGS